MLAEALAAPLLRAVGEVQAQRLLPPSVLAAMLLPIATAGNSSDTAYSRADPRLVEPPPPMIPGNFEKRTLLCAMPVGPEWQRKGCVVCSSVSAWFDSKDTCAHDPTLPTGAG